MDIHGEVVDLELLDTFKKAQLLGCSTRIVEKRWRHLTDAKSHFDLQKAKIKSYTERSMIVMIEELCA